MDGSMSLEIYLAERDDAGVQSELLRAVWEELKGEAILAGCDVRVDVAASVATLKGTVASYAHKLAAERAAHRVRRLRAVRSEIRVAVPED